MKTVTKPKRRKPALVRRKPDTVSLTCRCPFHTCLAVRRESERGIKEPAEDGAHHPAWIKWIQAEAGNLWKAKWGVMPLLAMVIYATYWFEERSYTSELKSKDAIIQNKESTIQSKDAVIDRQKRELELRGNPSSSQLKSQALILAKQLDEAGKHWPDRQDVNAVTALTGRFDRRIERVRQDLDEQGLRSADLDKAADKFLRDEFNLSGTNVTQLAVELQKLASQLKE